jgi:hypothetical protein
MQGRRGLAPGMLLALVSPLAARSSQEAAVPPRSARPVPQVEPATSPIKIDGVLDEAAWSHAAVVPLKFETRPKENLPPDVATEMLLTYDADSLYVGFRAHDPDPAAIRAHFLDRDKAFDDDSILQYTDLERAPVLYLSPVDKRTETLFSQLLFSYKLNPQTVLFLGYSDDSLGDERIDLTRADRTLFMKIGYAWVP